MPRLALYAGSFDPITLGHLDVLQQALLVFDEVEIAIGVNGAKQSLFTVEERIAMIRASTEGLPGVTVAPFEGLLVTYARSRGAVGLIRGLRQVSDFDYEMRMAMANRRLAPEISTALFIAAESQAVTASSIVREIWRWDGDVSSFVPEPVLAALMAKKQAPS